MGSPSRDCLAIVQSRHRRRRGRRRQRRWDRRHRSGGCFRKPVIPRTQAGQAYVIFGQTSFSAPTFDLASLNGSNGFKINGKANVDFMGWHMAGVAGDVNGDGVDDVMLSAHGWMVPQEPTSAAATSSSARPRRPPAPSRPSWRFPRSMVRTASSIYGATAGDYAFKGSAAGDVNGDGYDDVLIGAGAADPNGITNAGQSYIVYGRSSFGASFQLSSLLAINGGDGSLGYALNGFIPYSTGSGLGLYVTGLGDINNDNFADVTYRARRPRVHRLWPRLAAPGH